MASRKPPTERQQRLGAELRKMREQVGLSLTEAAELHRVDKATISNTESARYGVSSDRVRVWAANYSCPDRKYVDALAEMARERGANWWDTYRGLVPAVLLDLAELEHHAVALRTAQLTHMPGLLQHEDYARAVIGEAVPDPAPEDLDRKVEFRVRRSAVLDLEEPPSCTFLIHEAALRMLFGGARVAKRQLAYLLEQSDRENVTVRILPFAAGGFPSAGSSTMYAYGPVAQLDTVQSDTRLGSRFLHAETHRANYRMVLDRMEERSLDPDRSREFIREVVQQL
ncbi:helix-turn-helix domain-containing protein [Streptomyces sp. NBC_00286]|uniref:helix-turn-helix domain-containing protein n=1 Tax=Streptomyces sp. NBC_00286 TaxID=2975701 RepID=UPI002E2B3DA3|nr:helix-turn-helix transcriptional regulator [Streptomyces sp. NBC_00286]